MSCSAAVDLAVLMVGQQLLEPDDHGRVADQPRASVDHLDQLGEGPDAVLGPCLGEVLAEPLELARLDLRAQDGLELVDVQPCVPDVELPHPSPAVHGFPVRRRDREVGGLALGVVEAAISSGDREAGRQPLDVPLERARQGLVEVVDAEDEPAVRGGVRPEVGQVGIAAELHGQAGAGNLREVGSHQVGGAAEERERATPACGRSGSGPARAPGLPPAPRACPPGRLDPAPDATSRAPHEAPALAPSYRPRHVPPASDVRRPPGSRQPGPNGPSSALGCWSRSSPHGSARASCLHHSAWVRRRPGRATSDSKQCQRDVVLTWNARTGPVVIHEPGSDLRFQLVAGAGFEPATSGL